MLKLGAGLRETTPRGDIAAVIDGRPDGRPMRAVSPGPGVRPSGIYASQKSGRGHPWESKLELHDLWRAEVMWEVVESWCQPCRIWLDHGAKTASYVPDRKDRLADGTFEYVEVKPKFDPDKDAAYTEKLLRVEAILTGLGHRFRIIERAEIEAEPAYSAIKVVQAHRRTRVDPIEFRKIQDMVGHGAPTC